MDRQPPSDPPVVRAALARAIALTGSQAKLAAACGVSQAAISRVNLRGRVSARLALGIHRATGGAVPGSLLRPDLWRCGEDVPAEAATSIEPQRPADALGASADGGEHLLDRVGERADRGQQGDHGAFFRLAERSDGILIEILAGDSARHELDPGKPGAEHLAQLDRDDERARIAHDRRHEVLPLTVRIRTANYPSANYSVAGKPTIVSLFISVIAMPEHPGTGRQS
jgi:DNA-binding transcriptional regulator YdaS (Cro superfamily)